MKTYVSQAASRHQAAQCVKQQIIQLLNIDEMEYCEMQINAGICFLAITVQDEQIISLLENSKIFWNWFKNHWLLRDEQFIQEQTLSGLEVNVNGELQCRDEYSGFDYSYYHNAYNLASVHHPAGKIMQSSFAVMIGLVIKNEVKQ